MVLCPPSDEGAQRHTSFSFATSPSIGRNSELSHAIGQSDSLTAGGILIQLLLPLWYCIFNNDFQRVINY